MLDPLWLKAPPRPETPRYKSIGVKVDRNAYIELEVIDNSDPNNILLRNEEGETFFIPMSRMVIKAQHSYDRHFMTTVGAKIVLGADRHHAYQDNNFYVWRLKELRYGTEVWRSGFRY